MKIKTTITKSVKEEKEFDLELPYFCKFKEIVGPYYYKVESKEKVITVYINKDGSYATITASEFQFQQNDVLRGTVITADEWYARYNEASRLTQPEATLVLD
jgi:hypothetical protein